MESARREAGGEVELQDVRMSFGTRRVLDGISCTFPPGQISVILGGSGSGKTTLLRVIGGLVCPQSGKVLVDGDNVVPMSERDLYAVREKIGMMFQGGALLDSFTVFDNLAFPLREHTSMGEEEISRRVHEQLEAVGMPKIGHLLPGHLSGGMVKRAALARAIIRQPEILLCDEPFSGLDPVSVKRIEALLVRTNRRLAVTMLVSSHHIPSTMRMADNVVLLRSNEAITGTPEEMRNHADPSVAEFFDEEVDEERASRIESGQMGQRA